MTLSIEQFRERLVDYLYGELEGESLREFEASLRASEQCRRELEAMKETLRISREGVAALRALDEAPPSRVSRAVLAAAAAAQGRELAAEPAPASSPAPRSAAQHLWSWLRTPWLLPTLGVAAAVSVVVLHKRVESPQMPRYQSAPEQRADTPRDAPAAPASSESYAPAAAQPSAAAEESERAIGVRARAGGGPLAEADAPANTSARAEQKRAPTAARARSASPDRLSVKRANEAFEHAEGFADEVAAPSQDYAAPPPAWSGRAREESPQKGVSEAPRASASPAAGAQREAASAQDKAVGSQPASGASRGAGAVVGSRTQGRAATPAAPPPAAPPASRARSSASEPAPAQPGAPAPALRAPAQDMRPGLAAEPATRAPDESVKRALEHMTARRFSQAAVAYRELLSRYPEDPRAPEWRRQLTAALQALSSVDAVR